MPQRGVQHTTMTDEVRIALCQYKKDNPKVRQKVLVAWLEKEHNTKVAQSTISGTLKRSAELLHMTNNINLSQKRQHTVKYPEMEEALAEWFHANQDRVNMSGDLLKESAKKILDRLYPVHATFEFSNGWLESFKNRHGIRSYRRFGESGSVNMEVIEGERPKIREILDKYELKDIYNMDETGLFYRMQVSFKFQCNRSSIVGH